MPTDAERWQAWDRFVEASPQAGFMQSSWWARFRAGIGYEYFLVALKDGATLAGGALVGKWRYAPGRCFYYVQDGPVLPEDPDGARAVFAGVLASIERHRAADRDRVSHLRIEPRWERLAGFVRGFRRPDFRDGYVEPRHSLWIDLRAGENEILAQMRPKGRYNIRVAQRHGVRVVEDNSARGLQDFLRIYGRTALRQRMERKPAGYFRALREQPGVSLHFAEWRARRLAAALVVAFGARATYFYGASLAVHRRTMAPYLLHFEIMRAARARGCEWYDLWGVAPPEAVDHPWQEISAFKRKFGGREIRLLPTLDLALDAAAYGAYAAQTRKAPARREAAIHAAHPAA